MEQEQLKKRDKVFICMRKKAEKDDHHSHVCKIPKINKKREREKKMKIAQKRKIPMNMTNKTKKKKQNDTVYESADHEFQPNQVLIRTETRKKKRQIARFNDCRLLHVSKRSNSQGKRQKNKRIRKDGMSQRKTKRSSVISNSVQRAPCM